MKYPFFLFVCFLTISIYAANAIAGRVLVVAQEGSIKDKLHRELAAQGFDVVYPQQHLNVELSMYAKQYACPAVIRLQLENRHVEVWVSGNQDGSGTYRTVDVVADAEPMDSIVVLAAAELLRATLLEIYTFKSTPSQPTPPPIVVSSSVDATLNKDEAGQPVYVSLSVGPGFTMIGRGAGISANIASTLGLHLWGRLQFTALGIFPIGGHQIEDMVGTVEIQPFVVAAAVSVLGFTPDVRIRPVVGAGMGSFIFITQGAPIVRSGDDNLSTSSVDGRRNTTPSPMPFLYLGIVARVRSRFFVRLDCLAGLSTRENIIRFEDRTILRPGRPLFTVNLAAEFYLW